MDTSVNIETDEEFRDALNEYLKTVPEYKYITVDIPLDLVELEWVNMIGLLHDWCRAYNRHTRGRLKFKVDPIKRLPDMDYGKQV